MHFFLKKDIRSKLLAKSQDFSMSRHAIANRAFHIYLDYFLTKRDDAAQNSSAQSQPTALPKDSLQANASSQDIGPYIFITPNVNSTYLKKIINARLRGKRVSCTKKKIEKLIRIRQELEHPSSKQMLTIMHYIIVHKLGLDKHLTVDPKILEEMDRRITNLQEKGVQNVNLLEAYKLFIFIVMHAGGVFLTRKALNFIRKLAHKNYKEYIGEESINIRSDINTQENCYNR